MARICLFLSLGAALLTGACGGNYTPSVQLALDGPQLAVAMRNGENTWHGLMDRGCMAGAGAMVLHREDGVTCGGEIDHPATDKGRLHMDLRCTNGDAMALVFRNLGPDQGMGLGRINPEQADGAKTTFFYHPSPEEADRRLEQVLRDIERAMEQKREKDEQRKERASEQEHFRRTVSGVKE